MCVCVCVCTTPHVKTAFKACVCLKSTNNHWVLIFPQGWKNERVVRQFHDGRIVVILPTDPKHHLKKVCVCVCVCVSGFILDSFAGWESLEACSPREFEL